MSLWGAELLVTSQRRSFKTFRCYRIVWDILCMNAAYSPPPPPLSSPFNQLSFRSWHRLNTTGAGRRCHASSLPSTTQVVSRFVIEENWKHTGVTEKGDPDPCQACFQHSLLINVLENCGFISLTFSGDGAPFSQDGTFIVMVKTPCCHKMLQLHNEAFFFKSSREQKSGFHYTILEMLQEDARNHRVEVITTYQNLGERKRNNFKEKKEAERRSLQIVVKTHSKGLDFQHHSEWAQKHNPIESICHWNIQAEQEIVPKRASVGRTTNRKILILPNLRTISTLNLV